MTGPNCRSWLLDQAAGYCLSSLEVVTPSALHSETPCTGWDLEAVLNHLGESLSALREGARDGHIALDPPVDVGSNRARGDIGGPVRPSETTEPASERVDDLRRIIGDLLRDWRRIPPSDNVFSISDLPLDISVVESVAAVEIAVHGWDVFESCGVPCQIPEQLALALLPIASSVIDEALRPMLFAAPVSIDASAGPSDRLVAFLGRRPGDRDDFRTGTWS
jgi:uncharacterized protein (TIGR03083 family)